jgi:hypothetical protein
MVASNDTVREVVRVVRRHVDMATFHAIMDDLKKVSGNASFVQTIDKIHDEVITEQARSDPDNPPLTKERLKKFKRRD